MPKIAFAVVLLGMFCIFTTCEPATAQQPGCRFLLDSCDGPNSSRADDTATCNNSKDDKAIAACSRLIKRGPRNDVGLGLGQRLMAINYYARGLAYKARGDYYRAIADYDQAIRLDPKDPDYYYVRGNAYLAKGDPDRAIADYDQAIKMPSFAIAAFPYAQAYNNRGAAYSNKGDYHRAIANYDQAIELDPSFTVARQNRERAQARLAPGRL